MLFALLIGALLLKEPLPPIRLLACGVIAAGVVLLRLL
ncbi:drug/metabolite transporter (DMT)-like permease [Metapseudomonas resinovorans]